MCFFFACMYHLFHCILLLLLFCFLFFSFFFFSSRRRHTRCLSDWSSDVCSSDLGRPGARARGDVLTGRARAALLIAALAGACSPAATLDVLSFDGFLTRRGRQIELDGRPYRFVGLTGVTL